MDVSASTQPLERDFFEVRLNSIASGHPLPCDIYVLVNSKPTLLRRSGDLLTEARWQALRAHGAARLLVPVDQRNLYRAGFSRLIRDPGVEKHTKGRLIKESAFLQIQDLFRGTSIQEAVQKVEGLVEDMLSFLSQEPTAAQAILELSAHDNYTFNHSVNVAVYSILLSQRLYGSDKKMCMAIGMAALLHDIGKKEIPATVTNKLSPLTAEETALVRQHPLLGAEIVKNIPSLPTQAREVVIQHHENFDGSGYPFGLAGDKISLFTRIVSIADTFDGLTTARPTQRPFTSDEALSLMKGLQPQRFDPAIFQYFNSPLNSKVNWSLTREFDPCSPQPIAVMRK